MKFLYSVFALIMLTAFLCSCTNSANDKSDYVYYFGLDKGQENDVVMYALMKNEVKESDKDKNKDNSYIEEYTGKNVSETFESFFEKHKDAYTGTVKEYAVGESMGENGLEDLRVYIANSPRLPAKRKTEIYDSGAGFVYEKLEENR